MGYRNAQMTVARKALDTVLKNRTFTTTETVGESPHEDKLVAKSMGFMVATSPLFLKQQGKNNTSAMDTLSGELAYLGPTAPDYWLALGEKVAASTTPPRCNGAAALAVYLLANDPAFTASLDVVEVGGKTARWQHWFVVANHDDGADLTMDSQFYLSDPKCFIADLWGAANFELTSAVKGATQKGSRTQTMTGIANLTVHCRVRERQAEGTTHRGHKPKKTCIIC
jgi:hypothetical protein